MTIFPRLLFSRDAQRSAGVALRCASRLSTALMVVLAAFNAAPAGAGEPRATQPSDFFEARIRPILAEHCWSCHGPKKQSGGLRFDSRKGLLDEGEQGPVVVPGHPEKSGLVQAIRHTGAIKMPPKSKLPPQAIDALTAWIKMGAPWPETKTSVKSDEAWKTHWAFQPIRNPAAPTVKDLAWPKGAIDRFVLAELEKKSLRPSHPADPRTLIRRMQFDLVGLPPTAEEVQEFVAAWDAGGAKPQAALEKLVDRLLASPHYGERWGRYWLDVARYADTKGYVFFEDADFTWAWTYRDYVIEAFNRDLPFDRFILEQLAADQLPLGADKKPLRALGYLTLGGRFMNNAHDIVDDRIDVVTRGLMGLTVTCARCHDHKYDPLTAKDYYGLYGVFASCAEPMVPPLYEPPPTTDVYAKFDKELHALEAKLFDFVSAKHQELMTKARTRVAEYMLAAHAQRDQPSTEEFMLIADGADLNPTMIVRWQKYLDQRAKKADRVFGPWHALSRIPDGEFANAAPLELKKSLSDPKLPVNPLIGRALADCKPRDLKEVAQAYANALHAADREWRAATKLGKKQLDDPDLEELRLVFYGADAPANVAMLPYGDLSLLPDRASQATLQAHRKALEKWRTSAPGAPPRALVLEDLATPHAPRVFLRGNPNNLGEPAPRQLPSLLGGEKAQPFKQGSGRLELAQAIADRANPLTARVIVNRVWQHHFGEGLVRTPSDFGLRSDPPSHPELLDHLATWFMDNGWSLKKLHRFIVLSAVYQQSSNPESGKRKPDPTGPPDSAFRIPDSIDPENRLLWKMNRRRLDFEATRDTLLAVSGKLDGKVGGPSVRDALTSGKRRTMYSHLDRLNVPGLFRTFDFPSPDATSPQRDTTTVAPQALFLMNHPFVMDCARAVMQRPDVAKQKETSAKVDRLHRVLFGRGTSSEELRLAQEYLQAQAHSPVAWDRYAHALMLANELVVVD